MLSVSPIHQILDLARWAPSGDNSQPWRFEIVDDRRFVIHGFDTRDHCVYDLDGRPSQISLGALIETIDIAASIFGFDIHIERRTDMPDTHPTFDVVFESQPGKACSDLAPYIPMRSVHRRPMELRTIVEKDRHAMREALEPDYELLWFGSLAERLNWASMLWTNAGIRLRLPEAFDVHRGIIEWHKRFSIDRIPDQALGASSATLFIMRHAMNSWKRVAFLNRWLGGTLAPRLEMDWVPALACGAHFAIVARQPPRTIDDYVHSGRAVLRFWLTATKLGLQHQPAVTPLIFSRYVREARRFTEVVKLHESAAALSRRLDALLGGHTDRAVWLGRIGHGRPPLARSERKPLERLLCVE